MPKGFGDLSDINLDIAFDDEENDLNIVDEDYDFLNGEDDDWVEEIAVEAGMLHGVRAYNETRGFDVDDVEPCGHHCDLSCPRCGGD